MTQNPPRLTQNQRAVLFQASLGKTRAEIADALGLSVHTVRAHIYIARCNDRDTLSPTQEAVVHCASRGLSNQEIADELGMSVHTVKTHKHAAVKVLGREEWRRRVYRNG